MTAKPEPGARAMTTDERAAREAAIEYIKTCVSLCPLPGRLEVQAALTAIYRELSATPAAPALPRMFPIQDGPAVPWDVIAPFDHQCQKNHGRQTLERIAERGGLSCTEAIAVLLGVDYFDYWEKDDRYKKADHVKHVQQLIEIVRERQQPAAAPALDPWQTAALLKDRTRRAIRDRVKAGESLAEVAADYGVPEAFVSALTDFQLGADEAAPALTALLAKWREREQKAASDADKAPPGTIIYTRQMEERATCWALAQDELEAALTAPQWHPIETLTDPDREVLLWTPTERLHTKEQIAAFPDLPGDLRISSHRYWTWATHWAPRPDPPAALAPSRATEGE